MKIIVVVYVNVSTDDKLDNELKTYLSMHEYSFSMGRQVKSELNSLSLDPRRGVSKIKNPIFLRNSKLNSLIFIVHSNCN